MIKDEGTTEEVIVLDPLLADIFTAMFTQTASISEQIDRNNEAQIHNWQQNYASLWEAVSRISEKIDSGRLERLLDQTTWTYEFAIERIHERKTGEAL